MLAKKNRLTKTKEIDLVFKKGRSAFCVELGVKIVKNDLEQSRFTIIVSTKVSKKATERNLIKRRIRAALRDLKTDLKKGYDVVIITKPEIKTLDYMGIKNSLEKLLKKLKLV